MEQSDWLKSHSKHDDFSEMELQLISGLLFFLFIYTCLWIDRGPSQTPSLLSCLRFAIILNVFQNKGNKTTVQKIWLYQSLTVLSWTSSGAFLPVWSKQTQKKSSSPSLSPVILTHLKHNKLFSLLQGRLGCTGICPPNAHTYTHPIQLKTIWLSCHSIWGCHGNEKWM